MVGWHHRLEGNGFGWTLGGGDGQGGLVGCDSWGRRESDATEQPDRAPSPIVSTSLLSVSPSPFAAMPIDSPWIDSCLEHFWTEEPGELQSSDLQGQTRLND